MKSKMTPGMTPTMMTGSTATKRLLAAWIAGAAMLAAGPASAQVFKPAGCRIKIRRPGKRKACLACVSRKRPHAFYRAARRGNRCRPLAVGTAAHPLGGGKAVKTVAGCSARVRKPAKRTACVQCLRRPRPHVFLKNARVGLRCRLVVATPGARKAMRKLRRNAPPGAIVAVVGCNRRVKRPGKRAACKACVSQRPKHWYFKGRRPGNRCVPAR